MKMKFLFLLLTALPILLVSSPAKSEAGKPIPIVLTDIWRTSEPIDDPVLIELEYLDFTDRADLPLPEWRFGEKTSLLHRQEENAGFVKTRLYVYNRDKSRTREETTLEEYLIFNFINRLSRSKIAPGPSDSYIQFGPTQAALELSMYANGPFSTAHTEFLFIFGKKNQEPAFMVRIPCREFHSTYADPLEMCIDRTFTGLMKRKDFKEFVSSL